MMKRILTGILVFAGIYSNAQVSEVLTRGGVIKRQGETYKVRWTDTANYEGNSITNGGVATQSQFEYVSRVTARTGAVENRTSVGSSSVKNIIFRRFTNMPAVGVRQSLSMMIGINDILNSSSANKITKISEGIKTVVANQFLETYTPIDSATITATGTWASLTDPNISSKSVILGRGTPKKSSTTGSKLSFSHYGDNLVVGTWGVEDSHTTFGTFKVTIDGVIIATYDVKGKSDDWYYAPNGTLDFRMPTVLLITGLTGGRHAVEIEVLENKEVDFDYIGRLAPPANCKSVILIHTCQTEVNAAAPAGTNAFINATNLKIDTIGMMFRNLGYPIAVAKTENYLDTATTNGGSGIHPNDLGHFQIANAVMSVIDTTSSIALTTTGSGAATYNKATKTLNIPTPSTGGTPGGSAGEIQFKGSVSQFAGNPRFAIDSTNQYMKLGNAGSTFSRFYSQQQSSTDRLVFNTGNNVHSFYMQNNGDFNIPGNLNFDGTTKGITLAGANSNFLKMSRATSAGAFRAEFITNTTTDYYIGYRGSVLQLTFDGQNSTSGFVFGNNISGAFENSAQMEIKSTTKGLLIPKMTLTNRDAITSPARGLQVYDSTNNGNEYYNGTNWAGGFVSSAAGTLTLKHGEDYSFTGTTTTYTLPAVSASLLGRQNAILIMNRGSGSITLNSNAGSTLYTTSAQSTITIIAGASAYLVPDGTYFKVVYNL